MKVINSLDEKNRLFDVKFYFEDSKQMNSHGFSYLQCRKIYQECKEIMGLDAMFEAYDNCVSARETLEAYLVRGFVPPKIQKEYVIAIKRRRKYDDYLKNNGIDWEDVFGE